MDELSFTEMMICATTQAEAGFHFEEGGCWGMALALRDALMKTGHQPHLAVTYSDNHPHHALVAINDRLLDHQGMAEPRKVRLVDELEFMQIALQAGWSTEEIESDREWAAAIIELAQEMTSRGDLVDPQAPAL